MASEVPHITARNPDAAIQYMVDVSDDYAEACANVADIDNGMKRTRAELMRKSPAKTVSEREADALAHPDMLVLIRGYREAIYRQTLLKVRLKAAELAVDVYRTKEASARNEMRATR